MAGATQRNGDDLPRPSAREGRLSNDNKVVRLPRVADPNKTAIADDEARRRRLVTILTRLVERDVVPRLLSATTTSSPQRRPPSGLILPAPPTPVPANAPSQDTVVAFADSLLHRPGEAAQTVARLRLSGVAPETLCLHLLTGAARHLGDLWEQDLASFADVTIATDHLQQIFRDLAPDIAPDTAPAIVADAASSRSALLVATPGEQHSFGLTMLATFFRASGWTARTPKVRSPVDIQRLVASTPFDLIGLSLGAEIHLGKLARCIELARRSSCRDLVVMVGGPIFVARPELATSIGADATASDAPNALDQAERLLCARRA